MIVEKFRENPFSHLSVLNHVRDARRNTQIVFKHEEVSRVVAHQISAANVSPRTLRGLHSDALSSKVRRGENELGGNNVLRQNFLPVINVVDKSIKRPKSLCQASAHVLPIASGDSSRNDVKWPFAVDVGFLRIDRKAYSHLANSKLGEVGCCAEFLCVLGSQPTGNVSNTFPCSTLLRDQLIEMFLRFI